MREWRLAGHFYTDDLVLCCKLEENLRAMVGCFVKACRTRGLKFNPGERIPVYIFPILLKKLIPL